MPFPPARRSTPYAGTNRQPSVLGSPRGAQGKPDVWLRQLFSPVRHRIRHGWTVERSGSTIALFGGRTRALVREAGPRNREAGLQTRFQQMLAERDATCRVEAHAEGRAGRRLEGGAELLLRPLKNRFGPISGDVEARIRTSSAAEVAGWWVPCLTCATWRKCLRTAARSERAIAKRFRLAGRQWIRFGDASPVAIRPALVTKGASLARPRAFPTDSLSSRRYAYRSDCFRARVPYCFAGSLSPGPPLDGIPLSFVLARDENRAQRAVGRPVPDLIASRYTLVNKQ